MQSNQLKSNGVQAHRVKKSVGKVANRVHDQHRPKHGIGDSIKFARGDDLKQGEKHVEHNGERRKHHEPVKPCTVLPVSKRSKPPSHRVRVSELNSSRIHFNNNNL